jgi:hypothetical protein
MDIVEKLRGIVEALNWAFYYGRRDFQNLVTTESENDPKWYFFLDPISTDDSNKNVLLHNGYFMILSKSDLDQNYDTQQEINADDGKWRIHILPKRQFLSNEFRNLLECKGDVEVVKSNVTDVINFFDENMDGVLVNFSIKQYL